MDIYTDSRSNFLTFIDRFSRFAKAYYLEDRTNQTIIAIIRSYKSQKGHFNKLITDNEFKSINIKDFLREEGIGFHLVKSTNHTGNADIERFHNTITEKIRMLYTEQKSLSIKEKMSKAVEFYNKIYHSVTRERPIDIEYGISNKRKVYERIKSNKEHIISKLNNKREPYQEHRQIGYIKNYKWVRNKDEPKLRLSNFENVHNSNIKRGTKYDGVVTTSDYEKED